jgi:hypothetical protein
MRVAFYAITILCGLGSAAAAQQQAPAAAPVGVITAQRKPIAKTLDFVGRVEAIERVEIRARITGYLESVAGVMAGAMADGVTVDGVTLTGNRIFGHPGLVKEAARNSAHLSLARLLIA